MKRYTKAVAEGERLFVGVDQDKKRWQVTIRTADREIQTANIEAGWPALEKLLNPFKGYAIEIVYEAGYFGYTLYDAATAWGARCIVTPPSMLPQQQGDRVKTDKRDSRKLALYLTKGLLTAIWKCQKFCVVAGFCVFCKNRRSYQVIDLWALTVVGGNGLRIQS